MAEKSIHSGHRSRVKERFLNSGLDGFEKHNMLELLLFYSIPQKDTNELAHRLLNKFGSLKRVFTASVEELCKVDGISTHTAALIKLVPAIWSHAFSEVDKTETYESLSKLGKMLVNYYSGMVVETVCVVLLDNSWRIIDIVKICEGSVNQVHADFKKIVECAIKSNAAMVLLAHNHPGGVAVPSADDLVATVEIFRTCNALNIDLLEHVVIAGDKYEPILCKMKDTFWQKADKSNFYK